MIINELGNIVQSGLYEGIPSVAVYSSCERYRYQLTRTWDPNADKILFIMLNPSKATESETDPTVTRCMKRAERMEYGSLRVCNLFAWGATNPDCMLDEKFPVGRGNDKYIINSCNWADKIVAAWGDDGEHMQRCQTVKHILMQAERSGKSISILELTKKGNPKHPLYVSNKQSFQDWRIS